MFLLLIVAALFAAAVLQNTGTVDIVHAVTHYF
jgi:hypothetical protein